MDFLNVCAIQLYHLRRLFKRDHANHGDVAGVFEYAVTHAACTRIAACNKAANGGNVARAGVRQNLLAAANRAAAHRVFQICNQDAGFASYCASFNF